jgi:hypothetical protein
MTEDLLNRIRREMQERMAQLRDAVDERDRLQAELKALGAELRARADRSPIATVDMWPETGRQPVLELRPEADLQPVAELRPPAALRLAAELPHVAALRESPPPRLVSPKVMRLMCGRSSFARPVGPRGSRRVSSARQEPVTLGVVEA